MSTQQDATVNVHVNNQEAEEKVKELSARARQLRKEFAEAVRIGDKGTIAKTEKELKKVNKELNNATLRAARIRDAMKHLSQATPKELHNTLKLINQELNSGAVKRGSKEWKAYQEQIKQVNAELRKIHAESREVTNSFKDRIANIANSAVAITSGMEIYDKVKGKLKDFVNAYAEQDAAMANTQKFTGMTREEVAKLNEEMKKMDTRTPLVGLNELAQAAGRLGKNSVEDVMGFVRAGDIIGVAMDELGEDAPEIISKLAGVFNLESEMGTEKAMLSTGSAINSLSQCCAAGAPNLVEFASRMGAIASQSHMTMDEMLAFGAVLDSNNVTMEKGSTAMQGVITKMYADPAKFAKAAGIDVQEFTDALKRSSTEGIMMFVEALSKMDQMQMSSTLSSLHVAGSGVVQTFQTLAGKTDELKTRLSESKQAFEEASSAGEEFNIQNNTVEAQLEKAKEQFNQTAVALGEKLYPAMKYAISGTSLLMHSMKALIDFFANYKGVILSLTAAYVAYQVAVKKTIIIEKLKAAWTAICTAKVIAFRSAKLAAAAAVALFSGNIGKATKAWKLFSVAINANPIGLIASAITLVAGALINWISSADDAADSADNLKDKNEELKDSYAELHDKTAELANKEISQLEKLYNASTKETNSKKDRLNAAKALINQYPEYFGKLSSEAIMVGDAKSKYDQLTKSILNTAKARAAASLIEEEEKKLLSLKLQQDEKVNQQNQIKKQLGVVKQTRDEIFNSIIEDGTPQNGLTRNDAIPNAVVLERAAGLSASSESSKKLNEALKTNEKELEEINTNINLSEDRIKWLREQTKGASVEQPSSPTYSTSNTGKNPGKGNKESEEKKKREEAKNIMQNELNMIESNIQEEQNLNFLNHSLGLSSYKDYIDKKHQLTIHGIDMQLKALEDAGLTETDAYKALAKQKEKLSAEHADKILKIDLNTLDQEKAQRERVLTEDLYNPKSPMFGNELAYRQGLLESDIKYLEDKKKLYATDSEDYIKIQQEIDERIAQDQLQKQQETADAYRHFREEYGKASGSQREKMELDVLEELHKQGLITEEEYNKARNAIREKYRKEDREKERTVQSEYADMVVNLYDSFKKFFDELGQDGSNFWENLEGAATAAFALMSAGLQQYSAYVNAERDLELAKIEHHYDAEIEAAGKNTKKKEKLEKDKEAKIAEVKKKYNERAMKIEMANAVAQTALAAISAYASGSQVNVFMGPIAAALALAAGAVQIATIKKQHQAEAIGYYEGGFTGKSRDNHKEVGVVHANEFVANHKAVANPRLAPLFNLLDSAQRNNTVGSLTAQDVSNALGQGRGVTARAEIANTTNEQVGTGLALVGATLSSAGDAIDRLNKRIDDGIETVMIMDGERGFARKYENYNKLINRAR